jgi:DnaJ domain
LGEGLFAGLSCKRWTAWEWIMDDFAVLGIGRDASLAEIRRAYIARVKSTHPDATGRDTSFDFRRVTEAYRRVARRGKWCDTPIGMQTREAEPSSPVNRVKPVKPVKPAEPVEYPEAGSVRPRIVPRTDRVDQRREQAAGEVFVFRLGEEHVEALAKGDIAISLDVFSLGGIEKRKSFVVPKGTADGARLEYAGWRLGRKSNAGRVCVQVFWRVLVRPAHGVERGQ